MISVAAIEPEVLLGVDSEIERLRRRDPDALTAVITRHQYRLYRYLLRVVRDPAAAEDLFQQTWLKVFEKIRQYDPARSFETWLFSVARHLAIDHLRRKQPESLDEPRAGGTRAADLVAADGPSALEQLLESERANLVLATLQELPAIYREVLTLRFEEEMKLEEIADVTETPLGTVKSRLRRSLLALRESIAASPRGRP